MPSGSVYQANRLVYHQKAFLINLRNLIGSPEYESIAFGLEESCYDFESILLLTRSSLDRMTGHTMDLFGMESKDKSFRHLRNIFHRNQKTQPELYYFPVG
jgi:hypothetical protein